MPRKTNNIALAPAKLSPWDAAKSIALHRNSPCGIYSEPLEPGVNYFVLMLERLGAKTHYSCEGHPRGFYVVFDAPLLLAKKIAACGFFTVELEKNGVWSIRTPNVKTVKDKTRVLTWASEYWDKAFGQLPFLQH